MHSLLVTYTDSTGVQQSAEGAGFWKGEAEGKSKWVSC